MYTILKLACSANTIGGMISMGVGKSVVEEEARSGHLGATSSALASYLSDDYRQPIQLFPFRPGTPAPHRGAAPLSSSSLPQTPAASLDLGAATTTTATESDNLAILTPENAEALRKVMERRDPLKLRSPPRARATPSSPLASDDGHTSPTSEILRSAETLSPYPASAASGLRRTSLTSQETVVPPLKQLVNGDTSDSPIPEPVSAPVPTPTPTPVPTNSTTNAQSTIPGSPQSATETKPSRPQSVISPPSSSITALPQWNPPEKPVRCLVVDDDNLTRKLMSRLLQRLGCAVDTAANGQSAVEMIVASSEAMASPVGYDVVFLDNQMPVMSGLEAVGQLRDAGREDFVVGVTGNALVSDQDEYLAAGVNHILTKPVLERSLKAMLTIADQQRSQRILASHTAS